MARILVVEDEEKLARLEREYLERDGHEVDVLLDGSEAVETALTTHPDLLVLDLMLPGEDGLSICRRVRERSEMPIIMVTARVDEVDRLLGLELGADDYLCKPFSPRELVLRARAILRRGSLPSGVSHVSRYRDLELDSERFNCRFKDRELDLTPVEFRLLSALMERPGRVLSRNRLMDVAYDDHRVVSERTIDSHMRNLRSKLESTDSVADATESESLLRSVYGVGYALN